MENVALLAAVTSKKVIKHQNGQSKLEKKNDNET